MDVSAPSGGALLTEDQPPAVTTGPLLDRNEVATRIRMSVRTVKRLGAAGLIEEIRTGRRAVRVTERSVEQYLAARKGHRSARETVSAA